MQVESIIPHCTALGIWNCTQVAMQFRLIILHRRIEDQHNLQAIRI
jgi:hypothetical protein